MLNQIMKPKDDGTPLHLERQYTENTKNRKQQEVELRTGEIKKIDVAYGTMRVNMDTGRGAYKMIKRALAGKTAVPRSALKQLDKPSAMGERLRTEVNPSDIPEDVVVTD